MTAQERIQVRDLTDDSGFTCDWGACNIEAVAERYDRDTGYWLPVCPGHAGRIPRRASPGRGACAHCGREYALSVSRMMRAHDSQFAVRCPGSGARPAGIPPESEGGAGSKRVTAPRHQPPPPP